MTLARTLGKIAVLAGNCDGFIGNRMLMFYGRKPNSCSKKGQRRSRIDRVIEGFGFAMGPLAVADLAGNDVGLAIRKGRRLPPDERARRSWSAWCARGGWVRRRAKGFYRYEGRTRIPDPQVLALIEAVSRDLGIQRRQIPNEEILDRLLHPLVNEGARHRRGGHRHSRQRRGRRVCERLRVPRLQGGPMYWAQQAGLARVAQTMRRWRRRMVRAGVRHRCWSAWRLRQGLGSHVTRSHGRAAHGHGAGECRATRTRRRTTTTARRKRCAVGLTGVPVSGTG